MTSGRYHAGLVESKMAIHGHENRIQVKIHEVYTRKEISRRFTQRGRAASWEF